MRAGDRGSDNPKTLKKKLTFREFTYINRALFLIQNFKHSVSINGKRKGMREMKLLS